MNIREMIQEELERFVNVAPENTVTEEQALTPEMAGLVIFENPVFCIASAADPLFEELRKPEIMGDHIISPEEWMPGAKSIISFALPYTQRVRETNTTDWSWPSKEWMHGRIEGHAMLMATGKALVDFLESMGHKTMAPMLDPRIGPRYHFERATAVNPPPRYNSRWSERHTGFIAGLGTFGLSRGLITKAGVCARLGSIITAAEIEPDTRPYTEVYEYCTRCGACLRHCPADAITFETGKDNPICSSFIDGVLQKEGGTYYGCGKCQVGVPCEKGPPKKTV